MQGATKFDRLDWFTVREFGVVEHAGRKFVIWVSVGRPGSWDWEAYEHIADPHVADHVKIAGGVSTKQTGARACAYRAIMKAAR